MSAQLSAGASISLVFNPISYFQIQEGSTAVSWSQASAQLDSSTGNSVITFQDGNGGSSTMTWLAATGALSSWTITVNGGTTETFTDAIGQGCPGSFVLTSGAFGTNNVLSINGHPYVPNGNLLAPAQTLTYSGLAPLKLIQLVYGETTYSYASTGVDYNGVSEGIFSNGTATVIVNGSNGLQIYFPDGTCAVYSIDSTNRFYTYQTGCTAPNQLSQINGYLLTASGNTLSLPLPISSFVWGGITCTFSSIFWNVESVTSFGTCLTSRYTGGVYAQGTVYPSGSLRELTVEIYSPQFEDQFVGPGTVANTYTLSGFSGPNNFSAINGIPYVQQGNVLVPQGPVNTLNYGGNAYQFTGYSQASDGNWLAQYSTGGSTPSTASVEYSPANDAIVKMSINAAGGGTAVYVDGATVGQPGAYVWSNTSTAANALSTVNGNSYNSSGDSDLPGTATTINGVFKISGNFMSLGSWASNANQSGFDLSYYDGQSSSNPASVEFTGNRPLTSWMWDVASNDGTISNAVMQLDENSRLSLYPQADPTATTPTLATPTVILDPNPGGTSRFNGPVRIAPQGDLQMGEFTTDPTTTPVQ